MHGRELKPRAPPPAADPEVVEAAKLVAESQQLTAEAAFNTVPAIVISGARGLRAARINQVLLVP